MILIELRKQVRRPRTYLTYGVLMAFAVVLTLALELAGPDHTERVGDIPLFLVPSNSGLSISVIALASTMKFFLPLAVAIFAGETVAAEAGWGRRTEPRTCRWMVHGWTRGHDAWLGLEERGKGT